MNFMNRRRSPRFQKLGAGNDSRCATTAVVKEIHVALNDGEGCAAGGLVSKKFVTPKWVLIVALPALLPSWNSINPLLVMVAFPAVDVPPWNSPPSKK